MGLRYLDDPVDSQEEPIILPPAPCEGELCDGEIELTWAPAERTPSFNINRVPNASECEVLNE